MNVGKTAPYNYMLHYVIKSIQRQECVIIVATVQPVVQSAKLECSTTINTPAHPNMNITDLQMLA